MEVTRISGKRKHLTFKAEAQPQDGAELLRQLIDYRYDLQETVNQMWNLKMFSSWGQLYALFYERLTKEKGYTKSVAKLMYKKARKIVESAQNSVSKYTPTVKKLIAEFDVRDAKVDLEKGEVRVIFKNRGRWFVLKFKGEVKKQLLGRIYRLKNVRISYENGKFYVSMAFEFFM